MENRENETRTSVSTRRLAAASIVDLLLSMPDDRTSEADAVDRAVANRLQVELANRMRSLIGDEERQQAA